jgi:ribosomal protein S6--L-glutamate ligase
MLTAAVISLGSTSSKWTIDEMKKLFDKVDSIKLKEIEINLGSKEIEVLYKGESLPDYDCVYAKGSFRYIPLLSSITALLNERSYMPIVPNAFTTINDKLLTQLELQKGKIPMPITYLSSTADAAKKILEQVNYPIIMKFPQGTHGKGVMFAESFPAASSMLDALAALNQPFLIQEYVETGGVDIRALVVGDQVVAAMTRRAKKGEKRANIHAGGVGESLILSPKAKKIALDTAKILGAEICAVDMLEGHKGPVVIEANSSPGLQGITKATGINVAEKIAQFLYRKTRELKNQGDETDASKVLEDMGIEKTDATCQDIIANLDFRGRRILLPDLVTNITEFGEDEEVILQPCKGKLTIKKA